VTERRTGLEWLEHVGEIGDVSKALRDELGDDLERVCSGKTYGQAKAAMAVALDKGLSETGLSTRKLRRFSPKVLDWVFNGLAVAYVLGWKAGKGEGDAKETG